ncbi:hypothetical protein DPMN_194776 [Dreissena polymorpha]|uniref:Uncharacterized protein n=1 Tax=Dreissena polymorpha TaxID=45954 RepID=A0A9D4BEP1_DREPO|nr:hypothetical protein DPMN_194776 [Dreissena polymorpha]
MKLFREIQTARNVTVFPRSYDIIEYKTSGFLMIDYDKQHRFFTFSDREALDRFLYKPVQYELCCKINCVSSNVRRKEKAFKALKQKQVHSKVS